MRLFSNLAEEERGEGGGEGATDKIRESLTEVREKTPIFTM